MLETALWEVNILGFLIFMMSCENQEFRFWSVVFETNIINFLLERIKNQSL